MKQGKTIPQLAQELERQRLARKDYLADTRNLEVETTSGVSKLTLGMEDKTKTFTLNDLAHKLFN